MQQHSPKHVALLGPPVDGLTWMYPDQHPGSNGPSGQEGGIALQPDGAPVGVKDRGFRASNLQAIPGLFRIDTVPLEGLSRRHGASSPMVGIEVELQTVSKDGNPSPIRGAGGKAINTQLEELVGPHPELYAHTAEIDDGPHKSTSSMVNGLLAKFLSLQAALGESDFVDPASAWMDQQPTLDSVTEHPYVTLMVDNLGESILDFVGHGVHEHYDVDPEAVHVVGRYLQIVAPLLNAGLQSAPYMHGKFQPRLDEIFAGNDRIEPVLEVIQETGDHSWQSVRYPTRMLASPSGGVANMVHATREDVLRFSDQRLSAGAVNNVSRAYGNHPDVRLRYDLPPGRVEFCAKDNPLGRLETIKAYADVTWSFIKAIETVALSGDDAVEQLHTYFPDLFGREADPTSMTSVFERTNRNSLRIAKSGPAAQIEDGHGCFVPTTHQVERLFDFLASQNIELPAESIRTVRRSLRSDRVRPGDTFMDYYRTGIGTPSDYHHNHEGYSDTTSEAVVINGLTMGRTRAFKSYLDKMSAAVAKP